MDYDFNLTHQPCNQTNNKNQHKHTILNIINIPWQHLNGQIEHLAQEARFSTEAKNRSHLLPATGMDQATLKAALRLQPPKHHHILQTLGTGAGWMAKQLQHIGQRTHSKCLLCGAIETDAQHGLWHCSPVIARYRANQLKDNAQGAGASSAEARLKNGGAAVESSGSRTRSASDPPRTNQPHYTDHLPNSYHTQPTYPPPMEQGRGQ